MAKNPFKKENAINTAINVAIGGVANVAVDYAVQSIDTLAAMEENTINLGKFIIGALGSSMVSDKMLKAAMDGVAVVGISAYAKSLMSGSTAAASEATTGLPAGTIGRIRRRMVPGLRRVSNGMLRGVGNVPSMVG